MLLIKYQFHKSLFEKLSPMDITVINDNDIEVHTLLKQITHAEFLYHMIESILNYCGSVEDRC